MQLAGFICRIRCRFARSWLRQGALRSLMLVMGISAAYRRNSSRLAETATRLRNAVCLSFEHLGTRRLSLCPRIRAKFALPVSLRTFLKKSLPETKPISINATARAENARMRCLGHHISIRISPPASLAREQQSRILLLRSAAEST